MARGFVADVLEWLWDAVAGPVLDRLPASAGRFPRLWWSPVGPLSSLPLHAAARRDWRERPDRPAVLERVISSYTPTVRALGHAQAGARRPVSRTRLLIVAVPEGERPLPYARKESAALAALWPADELIDTEATHDNVLAALTDHAYVHFACHGASDPDDPSASRLLMHGDRPLTVLDVSRSRMPMARLAVLSACHTAHAAPRLADEALHIAGAFQLAGYANVVGTLWHVNDQIASRIAIDFHTKLVVTAAPSPLQSATALHEVIRESSRSLPGEPVGRVPPCRRMTPRRGCRRRRRSTSRKGGGRMPLWHRKGSKEHVEEITITLSAVASAGWRFEARRNEFGEHHPKTLAAAHELARALRMEPDRHADAAEFYQWLVAVQSQVLGPDHPETLSTRHEAGDLQYGMGNLSAAEAQLRDALYRRERVLGRDHADTLTSADVLGVVLLALGRPAEAEALHRDVSARRERLLGATHPETLASLGKLANSLRAGDQLAEAAELFQTIAADTERIHGAAAPKTALARNNLAATLVELGRGTEAAEVFRTIITALDGNDEHQTLVARARNNLATVLYMLGRYPEAEVELRTSVAYQERARGADHPSRLRQHGASAECTHSSPTNPCTPPRIAVLHHRVTWFTSDPGYEPTAATDAGGQR